MLAPALLLRLLSPPQSESGPVTAIHYFGDADQARPNCASPPRPVQSRDATSHYFEQTWLATGDAAGIICFWDAAEIFRHARARAAARKADRKRRHDPPEERWRPSHRWRAHESGVVSVCLMPLAGGVVCATAGAALEEKRASQVRWPSLEAPRAIDGRLALSWLVPRFTVWLASQLRISTRLVGEDGNLKLWQLGGGLVGRFGHGTWDLSRDGRGGAATVVTGIRDDGRGYEVGEGGIAGTGEDCRWGGTGTGTGERSGGDGVSSLFLTHVGEDAADEIRLAAREAGGIQTPLVAEKELPPPDFAAETAVIEVTPLSHGAASWRSPFLVQAGEMAEAVLSARGVPRSRGAHLRRPSFIVPVRHCQQHALLISLLTVRAGRPSLLTFEQPS